MGILLKIRVITRVLAMERAVASGGAAIEKIESREYKKVSAGSASPGQRLLRRDKKICSRMAPPAPPAETAERQLW